MVGGVEAIETYYSRYMPSVFVAVLGCLGVLATLAVIDPTSALVLAPFVIGAATDAAIGVSWPELADSDLLVTDPR